MRMGWKGFRFPEEPPQVNPDDPYGDPVALIESREFAVRRKAIDVEKAKLLREKVKRCYKEEGVNHQQVCRQFVVNYLESIKNIGVHVANSGPDDIGRAEAREKLGQ